MSVTTKVKLTQAERWHCGLLLSGIANTEIWRSEEARDLVTGDAVEWHDLDGGGFRVEFGDGSEMSADSRGVVVL